MLQQTQPTEIKVIFVDWHGVLSRDPFWISILRNAWHPLHQQLSEATENQSPNRQGASLDARRVDGKSNHRIISDDSGS